MGNFGFSALIWANKSRVDTHFLSPQKNPTFGSEERESQVSDKDKIFYLPSPPLFSTKQGILLFIPPLPSPPLQNPQPNRALGTVWFEVTGGEGRRGREGNGREREFNITLFGLIRRKEWNRREGESLMIICLVKEGRRG